MLEPWRSNISGYSRLLLAKLFPRDYSKELAKTAHCPPLLGIETTNICNADCVFCAYQYMERPKIIMDFDLYRKIVDDYAECGGRNVGLAVTVGDPLLDPRLLDRIAYGRSRGMQGFGFFTNGILLHKFAQKALLTSGLAALHISLAGFDRETYKKIYRVDIYHRVIDNTVKLAEVNNLLGRPVKITVSVRSSLPIRQLIKTEDYRRLRSLGVPVEFAIRYDSWSGKIRPEDLQGVMRMRPLPQKKQPCGALWFGATVHADGAFTVCGCRDLDGTSELTLGNLKEQSLHDLWTSEKLQHIKRHFTTVLPDICVDCTQYSPVSILNSWHFSLIRDIRPLAVACPEHA
ncbi:MAG: radical SAM protein [Acidobacteria bacterium]|nr:radical SAM protein [Acidobacteriota bacterium]